MNLEPGTLLTAKIAREICQRNQDAAVLEGSIAQIGTQFLLSLKAVNCVNGEILSSSKAQAIDKNHLLEALNIVSGEIRTNLGEPVSTVEKYATPVEQATTSSLEALQAYTQGRKAMEAEDYLVAISFFSRAVSLDPNFAMAYASRGHAYWDIDDEVLATTNLKKAYELRERVSERERFYIDSSYHDYVTSNLEKACMVYEQWAQAFPRDWGATRIAHNYSALGLYDKALAESLKGNRLSPSALASANVVGAYLMLNRFEEARSAVDEALKNNFDSESLRAQLYILAFLQNDAAGMARQVAWAGGKPDIEDGFVADEADSAAYFGQVAKARELSRRAIASAQRTGRKGTAAEYEATAAIREALFGYAQQAKEDADAALRVSGGKDVQYMAALALAISGDSEKPQNVMRRLATNFPEGTIVQSVYVPTLRAQMAFSATDFPRTIDALKPAVGYELGVNAFLCKPFICAAKPSLPRTKATKRKSNSRRSWITVAL